MSEKKEYHKKYYQKNKVRKPYVITQKVPIQEWPKPDEDGQLLDTERYILYINKIWSKHTLKYLVINNWGSYNIYDKNKILIRLKRENIISYIDKYHKYVSLNSQNTQ